MYVCRVLVRVSELRNCPDVYLRRSNLQVRRRPIADTFWTQKNQERRNGVGLCLVSKLLDKRWLSYLLFFLFPLACPPFTLPVVPVRLFRIGSVFFD